MQYFDFRVVMCWCFLERDGTRWNEMERDGVGWSGMERDGTGWNGMAVLSVSDWIWVSVRVSDVKEMSK